MPSVLKLALYETRCRTLNNYLQISVTVTYSTLVAHQKAEHLVEHI